MPSKHNKFGINMQWDTSGHERFRTITRTYFRGVSGIFIVYNATNEVCTVLYNSIIIIVCYKEKITLNT